MYLSQHVCISENRVTYVVYASNYVKLQTSSTHNDRKSCFHNCIVAMGASSSQFKVQYVKLFVSWNRHPSFNRRKGKIKVAVLVYRIQLYLLPETYKEQKQQIDSFYPCIKPTRDLVIHETLTLTCNL